MSSAESRSSLSADRVNFVDKHDSRGVFLCIIEKVADTRCADTDIKLDKIRAGNREKRHSGFTCDSLRNKGFTCSRRTYEQNALRYSRAELQKLFGTL